MTTKKDRAAKLWFTLKFAYGVPDEVLDLIKIEEHADPTLEFKENLKELVRAYPVLAKYVYDIDYTLSKADHDWRKFLLELQWLLENAIAGDESAQQELESLGFNIKDEKMVKGFIETLITEDLISKEDAEELLREWEKFVGLGGYAEHIETPTIVPDVSKLTLPEMEKTPYDKYKKEWLEDWFDTFKKALKGDEEARREFYTLSSLYALSFDSPVAIAEFLNALVHKGIISRKEANELYRKWYEVVYGILDLPLEVKKAIELYKELPDVECMFYDLRSKFYQLKEQFEEKKDKMSIEELEQMAKELDKLLEELVTGNFIKTMHDVGSKLSKIIVVTDSLGIVGIDRWDREQRELARKLGVDLNQWSKKRNELIKKVREVNESARKYYERLASLKVDIDNLIKEISSLKSKIDKEIIRKRAQEALKKREEEKPKVHKLEIIDTGERFILKGDREALKKFRETARIGVFTDEGLEIPYARMTETVYKGKPIEEVRQSFIDYIKGHLKATKAFFERRGEKLEVEWKEGKPPEKKVPTVDEIVSELKNKHEEILKRFKEIKGKIESATLEELKEYLEALKDMAETLDEVRKMAKEIYRKTGLVIADVVASGAESVKKEIEESIGEIENRLKEEAKPEIEEKPKEAELPPKLFESKVDDPLKFALFSIEFTGVKLEKNELNMVNRAFDEYIKRLEEICKQPRKENIRKAKGEFITRIYDGDKLRFEVYYEYTIGPKLRWAYAYVYDVSGERCSYKIADVGEYSGYFVTFPDIKKLVEFYDGYPIVQLAIQAIEKYIKLKKIYETEHFVVFEVPEELRTKSKAKRVFIYKPQLLQHFGNYRLINVYEKVDYDEWSKTLWDELRRVKEVLKLGEEKPKEEITSSKLIPKIKRRIESLQKQLAKKRESYENLSQLPPTPRRARMMSSILRNIGELEEEIKILEYILDKLERGEPLEKEALWFLNKYLRGLLEAEIRRKKGGSEWGEPPEGAWLYAPLAEYLLEHITTPDIRKVLEEAIEKGGMYVPLEVAEKIMSEIKKLPEDVQKEAKFYAEYLKKDINTIKALKEFGLEEPSAFKSAVESYESWKERVLSGAPSLAEELEIKKKERELLLEKIPGFIPTPKDVARHMVELAPPFEGARVLEPSAGMGNIAEAIREYAKKHGINIQLDVCEIHPKLREILKEKGFHIVCSDFLRYNPGPIYDRIYMNPPFEQLQDIEHVRHAYELLKPGGYLVAITSPSWTFRGDRKAREFREWVKDKIVHQEKLPEGTFKEYGTGVRAMIIVLHKPSEEKPKVEVEEKPKVEKPQPETRIKEAEDAIIKLLSESISKAEVKSIVEYELRKQGFDRATIEKAIEDLISKGVVERVGKYLRLKKTPEKEKPPAKVEEEKPPAEEEKPPTKPTAEPYDFIVEKLRSAFLAEIELANYKPEDLDLTNIMEQISELAKEVYEGRKEQIEAVKEVILKARELIRKIEDIMARFSDLVKEGDEIIKTYDRLRVEIVRAEKLTEGEAKKKKSELDAIMKKLKAIVKELKGLYETAPLKDIMDKIEEYKGIIGEVKDLKKEIDEKVVRLPEHVREILERLKTTFVAQLELAGFKKEDIEKEWEAILPDVEKLADKVAKGEISIAEAIKEVVRKAKTIAPPIPPENWAVVKVKKPPVEEEKPPVEKPKPVKVGKVEVPKVEPTKKTKEILQRELKDLVLFGVSYVYPKLTPTEQLNLRMSFIEKIHKLGEKVEKEAKRGLQWLAGILLSKGASNIAERGIRPAMEDIWPSLRARIMKNYPDILKRYGAEILKLAIMGQALVELGIPYEELPEDMKEALGNFM